MLILIWRKQEVFRRNTNTNFTEGRIQVAMYFITQATPDTYRKLWRLQIWPQTPLSTLVKEDFKVYNKWDLTEEAIRIKEKHSFWLLWLNQHLEGTLEGRGGWTKQEVTWVWTSVPFVRKEDTGRGDVLRAFLWDAHGATPTGPSSLQISWMRDSCTLTNGVPDPTLSILITPAEPQVILDVEGRELNFL